MQIKPFLSFFKLRFRCGLQYRAAALAGIATQFAWGFMYILLYHAFARTNPSAYPMTADQTSTYLWMHQAFFAMFISFYLDGDILSAIKDGGAAYELCRPVSLYGMWLCKNMATRLSRAVLRAGPILLIAFFLPEGYRMTLPQSPFLFFAFLCALLLAFLLINAISMLIYISVFYTMNEAGIRIVLTNLIDFCSGNLVPIPFLPTALQHALSFTPFFYLQNTPYLIYVGYFDHAQIPLFLLGQLLYTVVILAVGMLWMRRALSRVVIQGG